MTPEKGDRCIPRSLIRTRKRFGTRCCQHFLQRSNKQTFPGKRSSIFVDTKIAPTRVSLATHEAKPLNDTFARGYPSQAYIQADTHLIQPRTRTGNGDGKDLHAIYARIKAPEPKEKGITSPSTIKILKPSSRQKKRQLSPLCIC